MDFDPTALSNGLTILKTMVGAVRATGKAEGVQEIIELQSVLLQLQENQASLFDENRQLKERIAVLEREAEQAKAIEYHYDCYWTRREEGGLDGPFSAAAWDMHHILARMQLVARKEYKGAWRFWCNETKTSFYVPPSFLEEHHVRCVEEKESD